MGEVAETSSPNKADAALVSLMPGFAAEITGLDAATADDADVDFVRRALVEHPIVVLRDQHLSEEAQVRFGSLFGPLDTNGSASQRYNVGLRPDLLGVSNVGDDGLPLPADDYRRVLDMGNKFWHSDSSFKAVPAHLSMLYGMSVTQQGGETQFADLRVGYECLSNDWKAMIAELVALHSGTHSRAMLGFTEWSPSTTLSNKVAYPLVRTLPETGRRTLYLSAHACEIVGLPVPVGRMLLHELTELATTQNNVHTHHWRTNDLVIWDNRCTMHRLRRYNGSTEPRKLRRVTTLDPAFPALDPASVPPPPDWVVAQAP